jgi:hypothetical protein
MDNDQSRQRVILLGASNLTYCFPLIIESLRCTFSGPLDIFATHGHGRSYGMQSRILHRSLPGILNCDLWQQFENEEKPTGQTFALVTDVGNDLLYGADVETIQEWVETCFQRLTQENARIIFVALPMQSLRRLSRWRYYAARSFFFPSSRISYEEIIDRVTRLNDGLIQLGQRFNAAIVEPEGDWYGFDPIHIRNSRRRVAWRTVFSHWFADPDTLNIRRASIVRSCQLWSLKSAQRHIFRRESLTTQPAAREGEMSIWLY